LISPAKRRRRITWQPRGKLRGAGDNLIRKARTLGEAKELNSLIDQIIPSVRIRDPVGVAFAFLQQE
jgi:hypothetical protein